MWKKFKITAPKFPYLWTLRVHTEWRLPSSGVHSIMMEKSALAGTGGVCLFQPITITYKVAVNAPAEWEDTLTLFHLCTLCVNTQRHSKFEKCIRWRPSRKFLKLSPCRILRSPSWAPRPVRCRGPWPPRLGWILGHAPLLPWFTPRKNPRKDQPECGIERAGWQLRKQTKLTQGR